MYEDIQDKYSRLIEELKPAKAQFDAAALKVIEIHNKFILINFDPDELNELEEKIMKLECAVEAVSDNAGMKAELDEKLKAAKADLDEFNKTYDLCNDFLATIYSFYETANATLPH